MLNLLFRRHVVGALLLPSSSGQLAQRTAQLAVTAGTDKDTDTRFVAPHLVASFDRTWRLRRNDESRRRPRRQRIATAWPGHDQR
jgi:hypothetical protein